MLEALENLKGKKLAARFVKRRLHFKQPGGTSRGVMTERDVWYIIAWDEKNKQTKGIGECAPLPSLSVDDLGEMDYKLQQVCANIQQYPFMLASGLQDFPSIRFGLEMALLDLAHQGKHILFPSDFTLGKGYIPINGLIWMGEYEFMEEQIGQKLEAGFQCVKLKIGSLDFDKEVALLRKIRERFSAAEVELRVDANGAYTPEEAPAKLMQLAMLGIHSIEQPIKAGQVEEMAGICMSSPVPVALDEELIGKHTKEEKQQLLESILPQFIILKPSLLGGFESTAEWIEAAEKVQAGWWVTSALESNIGLNAIAQWTYTLDSPLPQGLGTGQLFSNNFDSPLYLDGDELLYEPEGHWNLKDLL